MSASSESPVCLTVSSFHLVLLTTLTGGVHNASNSTVSGFFLLFFLEELQTFASMACLVQIERILLKDRKSCCTLLAPSLSLSQRDAYRCCFLNFIRGGVRIIFIQSPPYPPAPLRNPPEIIVQTHSFRSNLYEYRAHCLNKLPKTALKNTPYGYSSLFHTHIAAIHHD